MRYPVAVCVACLAFLAGGCVVTPSARRNPDKPAPGGQADVLKEVRSRLPSLKPGMTEAQVKQVLSGVELGEEILVSRTISGGKTVRYAVSPRQQLELSFIPQSLTDPPPGVLMQARLVRPGSE